MGPPYALAVSAVIPERDRAPSQWLGASACQGGVRCAWKACGFTRYVILSGPEGPQADGTADGLLS